MVILVGLGNPGEKYQRSRHNVGWMFLDFLAKKLELPDFSMQKKVFAEISKSNDFLLVKPQTFMNDSGKAVQAALKWYGKGVISDKSKVERPDSYNVQLATDNLFLIYDDLDIELGKFKIQYGSGPKIHNGVNSVREHLNGQEFWNVRIGVDARNGDRSMAGSEYVLQNFSPNERQMLALEFPQIFSQLETKF